MNDLEEYGRRENIRIHNVAETDCDKDDGEDVVFEVANALDIELSELDLQRVHRIGKKKTSLAKPRPVIVRFISYQKMNEFLFGKSKLKKNGILKNVFITEDLTSLRSKLLSYVKNKCNGDFVLCHTYNGKIRMKRSAKKCWVTS